MTYRRLLLCGLLALGAGCEEAMDPPQYGQFLTTMILAEVEGRFTPADPGDSTVALVRPFVAGPALTPDFLDYPAVPFCVGFTFGAQTPPNVVSGDAGTMRVLGLERAAYRDLTQGPTPGPSTNAAAELGCRIADVAGTSPYVCDVPSNVLLEGSNRWLPEGEDALQFHVDGGAEIGAFDVEGLVPASTATTAGSFALDQVDPRGPVIAQWDAPGADLVMIELLAQRTDYSEGAQILCLADADDGAKRIPDAALALVPAASASAPVVVQTSLVGLAARRGYVGWGNYLFAAGRGAFGVTLLQ